MEAAGDFTLQHPEEGTAMFRVCANGRVRIETVEAIAPEPFETTIGAARRLWHELYNRGWRQEKQAPSETTVSALCAVLANLQITYYQPTPDKLEIVVSGKVRGHLRVTNNTVRLRGLRDTKLAIAIDLACRQAGVPVLL